MAFKRIIQAIMTAFPHHDAHTFQTVELCSGLMMPVLNMPASTCAHRGDANAQFGELRLFYNNLFLPRMQQFLVEHTPAANKASSSTARLPLQSLSAQDMNLRKDRHSVSRLGSMQ